MIKKKNLTLSQTFLGSEVAELQKQCAAAGCTATIIPAIHTLISGKVHMQPEAPPVNNSL